MEKRAHDRIPVSIEFHCLDMEYFGTVMDISETGMFIKSEKISFPLKMEFNITIPCGTHIYNLPIKVRRMTKSEFGYDGLGVELMTRPKDFLEFISLLRETTQPMTCYETPQYLTDVQSA